MSATPSVPPAGFDELSVDEQIDYVQALWRRIARNPESVPSPDWHFEVLERRLDAFEQDGDPGRSWQEVRAELQERLRSARK